MRWMPHHRIHMWIYGICTKTMRVVDFLAKGRYRVDVGRFSIYIYTYINIFLDIFGS